MWKKDWKLPFRDSPYNIRPKELKEDRHETIEAFASFIPQWDTSTDKGRRIMELSQQPNIDHVKLMVPEGESLNSQEMFDKIWASNEQWSGDVEYDVNNYSSYQGDIDHEYDPVQMIQQDRDYTGMESDARARAQRMEFEYIATERIGKKQIEDGQVKMYKGTLKKWQILDDDAHDADQIERLQAAVQAPLPEELEMYKEKHDVPMQLPFNNENVRAWRDEPTA